MKKLIFEFLIIFIGCCSLCVCSEEKISYKTLDFNGKIFISESYSGENKAKLQFSKSTDELEAINLPAGITFNKSYKILEGSMSPSGKPTIVVESMYYFIISNQKKLIYRYYDGASEKNIVFKMR